MMIKTNILHSIGGKKAWTALLVVLPLCLFLASCVDEDEYADNPKGNLEALWHIMDEHYCFFGEKNIDWNAIYEKYRVRVDDGMTELQLFEVLCSMLGELRDGHVNLYTSFDYGRNWSWHEDYPSNFSDTLQRRYLGTDYKIATGMRYRILDDNVGYIYLGSFSGTMGAGNLDDIMSYFLTCNGLILDIRDNSGGLVTSAEELAARFTNTEIPVGYLQHKTGKGHNDFSDMEEQRLKPSKGIRWQKRVMLLTNRQVFSAANEFVKYMKQCPNVTVVGDHTGGGAGLPFSSSLPNGWGVRFSACPMYDVNKQSTEHGIAPDVNVQLSPDDLLKGEDTIIETARRLLRE